MGRRQRRRIREHQQRQAATGAPVAAPHLLRLVDLIADARRAAQLVDEEIDRLACRGVGWPAIAAVLGVSRQAVRQRHQRRQRASRLP